MVSATQILQCTLSSNTVLHYLILSDLTIHQGLTGLLGAPGAEGKQGPMVGDS